MPNSPSWSSPRPARPSVPTGHRRRHRDRPRPDRTIRRQLQPETTRPPARHPDSHQRRPRQEHLDLHARRQRQPTILLIDGMRIGSATTGTANSRTSPVADQAHRDRRGWPRPLRRRRHERRRPDLHPQGPRCAARRAFAGAGSYGAREVSAGVTGGTNPQLRLRVAGTETEGTSAKMRKATGYNPDHDPIITPASPATWAAASPTTTSGAPPSSPPKAATSTTAKPASNNYNSAQRVWSVHNTTASPPAGRAPALRPVGG